MLRRSMILSLCGALGFAALVARPAEAQQRPGQQKVDRALRHAIAAGGATQPVIIIVKPGYRDSIRQSLQQHGDVVKSEHPLIDALAVELHSADVDELASHPWIEAVAFDAVVSAKASSAQSSTTITTLLKQPSQTLGSTLRETLGLPAVAVSGSPTGGAGVGVAVIDSGIAPNDDFAGRISGFYDFTRGGIPVAPYDDYGHGTHVAGLIGSSGKLSNYQYQGIAPDVRLVGLKVLDKNGSGKTSDVIKALEYVTANRYKLNVQIVNLSLGHPVYAPAKYDPLVQAVEKATAAGLIVVTASGNLGEKATGDSGYTGVMSPGNAPSAITVGAAMTQDTVTRLDDQVAPYSSRGPTWFDAYAKPDVVAPGHHLSSDTNLSSYLWTMLQGNHKQAKNGGSFLELSGTSMAAGVTTGVVALIMQVHNQNGLHSRTNLTANLVKAMLQYSAIPLAGADLLTQGAGQINAAGAVALSKNIDTDVAAGKWWLTAGLSPESTIGGVSYPWSRHVVWGYSFLTGNVLFASNIVWSTNVTWGTATTWGVNALSDGDNIVWGTSSVWGTNLVWSNRVIGLQDGDNIIWGTADGDNIIWGTADGDNIVWGTYDGDNIIWGTWDGDNIIWGTSRGDDVVWGTAQGDNVVWGTAQGDNVVWGTSSPRGMQ